MLLPHPRGPLCRQVLARLRRPDMSVVPIALGSEPVTTSADAQLALWMLYELHYRGFDDVDADSEWDVSLIALRRDLERRFEHELRAATGHLDEPHDMTGDDVTGEIFAMVAADSSPSVAAFLHRHGTREHAVDYLRERSVQQLKEADPQTFVLPRLTGAVKVAMAEIQYDEYGGGRVERLHQRLYEQALEAAGLDASYGAYVEAVSATSLASANVMSLFALNRRLRGAALGHFAAFEASSSVPSRKIAAGLERLGLPPAVSAYFHEHVEADSVHEQVAVRDVCGAFVEQEPERSGDVLFGAACVLHLDRLSAVELLARWDDDAAEQVA